MQSQETGLLTHMEKETICLWGYFVSRNTKKRMKIGFRLAAVH